MRSEFLRLSLPASLALAVVGGYAPMRAAESGDPKPGTASPSQESDRAALELGRKVLAIQKALRNPSAPDAMKAVTDLGHDSRYYVVVRGWLSQELAGCQSILDAHRGQAPKDLTDRIAFLRKAIRAIDLEK